MNINTEAQNANIGRARALKIRTTDGDLTIEEIFRKFYGKQLLPDPSPLAVRERALFLEYMYRKAQEEKTISQTAHGKVQVTLWNNIIDMLKKCIDSVETVNISLCNERRVVDHRT